MATFCLRWKVLCIVQENLIFLRFSSEIGGAHYTQQSTVYITMKQHCCQNLEYYINCNVLYHLKLIYLRMEYEISKHFCHHYTYTCYFMFVHSFIHLYICSFIFMLVWNPQGYKALGCSPLNPYVNPALILINNAYRQKNK